MLPMNKYAIVTSDDTHWTAYAEQYSPETGSVSFFVEGHVFTTIANVAGVDLAAAVHDKYGAGCPGCGHLLCTCDDAEKP